MRLTGRIEKGRRVYDNPAALPIAIRDIGEGNRFTEIIEREKTSRSLKQNSRHWSLIVPLAQECIRQTQQLILSPDQAHDMLCRAFIGTVDTPFGPVRRESKALSTEQFCEFDRKCEQWLRESWLGNEVELMELDA